VPWWTLAGLTVAVAGIHLWWLAPSPRMLQASPPANARPLQTRTITPEAPPLPPPIAMSPPPAVRERLVPAPRKTPAGIIQVASAPAERPAVARALPNPSPAAAAAASAFVIPKPMRLRYKVAAQAKGIAVNGEGQLQWRHDGATYEAVLEVSAAFLPKRVQRSNGRVTAQGLEPERFSDRARNEEAAHFERDQGKVSFSSNKPDAPLMAGAQDRLSVMLQLGAMIAAAPQKFPPGTSISIQTASTRDAEPWVFVIEAAEQLQLPGGTVAALRLTRAPRREFDQKVELWLAPGMDYVPVRLRLTQPNGDWVDQQWSSTDRG
jgi:hypothetical protein